MKLSGKAHKLGDDINTDYIISGKYKFKTLDMAELAKHVLEDLEPGFHEQINRGDFIVAGWNFGGGSSREQAAQVLLYAGIGAVIAKSFGRIFYRNAINVGLPVVECDTGQIDGGDELEVDLGEGVIFNRSKNVEIKVKPLPKVMVNILADGGLVNHFRRHGGFKIE